MTKKKNTDITPDYKFAFFGSPKFAEIVLYKLIESGIKPSVVICNPDRPVGRKKVITPPLTAELAKKYDIPVYQPEHLTSEEFKHKYGYMDFAVIAAYAHIIPQEMIDLFERGVIGVHPSLLPKWRGASPIQYSILSGEEKSGVSLYMVDEKMDHGPILSQKEAIIDHKDYIEAEKALAFLGGQMIVDIIPDFVSGKTKPKEQNHDEATFTKKIQTDDGFIDIADLKLAISGKEQESNKIYRKILGLNPEPGVYTIIKNKRIKLLESELDSNKIILKTIQIEGKKPTNNFEIDKIFS